jgi:hypothetical protein
VVALPGRRVADLVFSYGPVRRTLMAAASIMFLMWEA